MPVWQFISHFLKFEAKGLKMIFSILQGVNQDKLGIYIKSVVKGGAADLVSTQIVWGM